MPRSGTDLKNISFKRHRVDPDVLRLADWLYLRLTLNLRDFEDLLAQRGIDLFFTPDCRAPSRHDDSEARQCPSHHHILLLRALL